MHVLLAAAFPFVAVVTIITARESGYKLYQNRVKKLKTPTPITKKHSHIQPTQPQSIPLSLFHPFQLKPIIEQYWIRPNI